MEKGTMDTLVTFYYGDWHEVLEQWRRRDTTRLREAVCIASGWKAWLSLMHICPHCLWHAAALLPAWRDAWLMITLMLTKLRRRRI